MPCSQCSRINLPICTFTNKTISAFNEPNPGSFKQRLNHGQKRPTGLAQQSSSTPLSVHNPYTYQLNGQLYVGRALPLKRWKKYSIYNRTATVLKIPIPLSGVSRQKHFSMISWDTDHLSPHAFTDLRPRMHKFTISQDSFTSVKPNKEFIEQPSKLAEKSKRFN
ncbi:hypothetical protein L596_006273 [Steinernema carpocapsae]|uniref:Uncharacterized protein n=1 Tax=Steinernema carpocapsae TaxID=34508 RepID=A0A4U8V3F5_STECR|nr:hypothetical protein L596_006273 [Steinernema carpocapsae]